MFKPLGHDYIGLSDKSSMENFDNVKTSSLMTDLSLGLPGCDSKSPEKKPGCGVTLFGKELEGNHQNGVSIRPLKSCALGAKRVFSDAVDCSEKWVLSINGRSESNLSKDSVLLYSTEKVVVPLSPKPVQQKQPEISSAPAAKAQVVGWPPIRSYRKNTMATSSTKNNNDTEEKSVTACLYIKVSMDGAPYLRKVDLRTYRNYMELSSALEKMFSCFIKGQYGSHPRASHDDLSESQSTDHVRNSEYVLTYEDKDCDWMLVGDVPWKMFTENCRKLRIMKGSEAIGLAPKCS